jgi:hypothetical protein
MIVKFKSRDSGFPDLSEGQQYFVLGIEADDFRILNDVGKPYLYSPELFEIVDPTEPHDWKTVFGADGERYSYPSQMNSVGFFEDFFDQKPEQTSVFWHTVNQQLAHAA